jgi:hypothetical protein
VDPYQCAGEDKCAGNAVKEETAPNIHPTQSKYRNIKNEINYSYRKVGKHIMND